MSGADGGLGMPSAASSPRLQPQLSAAHTPPGRQALPPLLLAYPPRKIARLPRAEGRRLEPGLVPSHPTGVGWSLYPNTEQDWGGTQGEEVPSPRGAGGDEGEQGMHGMGSAPPRPRVQAWQERQEPPPSAVTEARHGEGTSKGLHALAQLCQAPLRLRILQQEGLELLELAWVQKGEGEAGERGMGGHSSPILPQTEVPTRSHSPGPC